MKQQFYQSPPPQNLMCARLPRKVSRWRAPCFYRSNRGVGVSTMEIKVIAYLRSEGRHLYLVW